MLERTLCLFLSGVEAQERHGVMVDMLAHRNLFLVVRIWSTKDFAIRITQAWRVVGLTHRDIARAIEHEVHAEDFEDFTGAEFTDVRADCAEARNVLRHSFPNMHNLPPHVFFCQILCGASASTFQAQEW